MKKSSRFAGQKLSDADLESVVGGFGVRDGVDYSTMGMNFSHRALWEKGKVTPGMWAPGIMGLVYYNSKAIEAKVNNTWGWNTYWGFIPR